MRSFRARGSARGLLFAPDQRRAIDMFAATLDGKDVDVTVKLYRKKRSTQQNRRYFALLKVGAKSLGWDPDELDRLHDEIAHVLLPLPPCPKTGLRRRERTPNKSTTEFNDYTDDVARKLIEFGADLSGWDEEAERAED